MTYPATSGNGASSTERALADVTERELAALFDDMAGEYDEPDPWYDHLVGQLAQLIRRHCGFALSESSPWDGLPRPSSPSPLHPSSPWDGLPRPSSLHPSSLIPHPSRRALDVGCGTGFPSLLLAELGYQVVGIDIAAELLRQARRKAQRHPPGTAPAAHFARASGVLLPFRDATFELVTCCGSTLSFIVDWPAALTEMARVVRPGGTVVLEYEQRWNLDLGWALSDTLLCRGRMGYQQSAAESLRNLFGSMRRGIKIRYPFPRRRVPCPLIPSRLIPGPPMTETASDDGDQSVVIFALHCFTLGELRAACCPLNLRVEHVYGLHVATNVFPSTFWHEPEFSPRRRRLFAILARIDARLKGTWPFNRLGCSQVLILRKE